jgi:hypothetical protein
MHGAGANARKHADLAKRQADLAAIHASLDFIESELLVKDVRSRLDRSRCLRDQLVAVREGRKSR